MTRKRQRLRPPLLAIAWALILIGLWILLSPIIHQELQIIRAGEDVQEFLAVRNQTATEKSSPRSGPRHTSSASDETAANSSETEAAEAQPESVDGSGLLAAMRRYNETIYQSSQPGRFAAEPFTHQVLDLKSFGLETDVVGVLEIKDITEQIEDVSFIFARAFCNYEAWLYQTHRLPGAFVTAEIEDSIRAYADHLKRSGPSNARHMLQQLEANSGYPTPGALFRLLEPVVAAWDQSLVCEIVPNELEEHRSFLVAALPDEARSKETLFYGPTFLCEKIAADLAAGRISTEQIRELNRQWAENDYEILQTPMWSSEAGSGWKTRVLNKSEAVAVRHLINTDTGRSCQDQFAKSFISAEIDHAISQHISSDAAIVYYCSIENQYGPSGARTVLQRARSALSMPDSKPITSLDVLHRGLLAAAQSYNSISAHLPYRKNVYAFLTGTLKLPAAPVEAAPPVPDPTPESPEPTDNPAPAPEATSELASTPESASPAAPAPATAPAEIKQAVGTVVASGLRLREKPSTASRILGIALRNEKVLVVSTTGDWCKVRFGQKLGYMHKAYLVQRNAENVPFGLAKFNVCANIRAGNHTGSAILDTANRGNLCVITGFDHGWFRILCGGKNGFVRSDLVSLVGE